MRMIDSDRFIEWIQDLSTKGRILTVPDIRFICNELVQDTNVLGKWVSVKDRLPEEHESFFAKFLGTPKWTSAMWKQESDKVLVCVQFPDGTSVVTTGCLHNSDWMTTVSKELPQTVTHWMPLPEPPEEVSGDAADRCGQTGG